jgi:hypothetical protein
VISERGQGTAGVGMGPRRALGTLAAYLDGPGALPAIGFSSTSAPPMASIPSHQGIEAMLSTAQPVIMDHHAGFRSK